MKTHLLCISLLFLFLEGLSQEDYYHLVEEDKIWYIAESGLGAPPISHIFKCEGDTLIDGENYKIIYDSYEEFPADWVKRGYIRETDDHKIYYSPFYESNPSYFEPGMVYDFNAELNDTVLIATFPYNSPYEISIVITAVDSILIDGNLRKRCWFECDYIADNFFIEGIGSNTGLLEPGFYCTIICPSSELDCVKKHGTTIFPDGYIGSCFIVGTDEKEIQFQEYEIFPNPATNFINIISHSGSHVQHHVEIFNSAGQLVKKLALHNNRITNISTSHFEAGLYLFSITEENAIIQKGKIVIQ